MNKIFYNFKDYIFSKITISECKALNVSMEEFRNSNKDQSLSKVQLKYLFTTHRWMWFVYHSNRRLSNRTPKDPNKNIKPTFKMDHPNPEDFFYYCGSISNDKMKLEEKMKQITENEHLTSVTNKLNDEVISIISEYWYGENPKNTIKCNDQDISLINLINNFNNISSGLEQSEWDKAVKKVNRITYEKEIFIKSIDFKYTYPTNFHEDRFSQYLYLED